MFSARAVFFLRRGGFFVEKKYVNA